MEKNTVRPRLRLALLLTCAFALFGVAHAQNPCSPAAPKTPAPLAVETFELKDDRGEVALDIEARSPGANWERKGSEAAALVVTVDGAYNQDVLLWAGEDFYSYRVMLGRLPRGRHKVSVALNEARSAAGARRAEVKSLHHFLTNLLPSDNPADILFALAHAPILYARANTIDHFTDIPLLMYFEILGEGADTIYRYTVVFTNEDGGTQTAALFARWGRGTDIEWVYEIRVRGGKIVAETFQGVQHETKNFNGQRTGGEHPLLAVASDNNNFSDLACSAVRFAPFPVRAELEQGTRESMMDRFPVTHRVMTEELRREGRISETSVDINSVADPREYLYIDATSEQSGAAIAFDVKVKGYSGPFPSDRAEPRLRIERSGYFRTAVRLPPNVTPDAVESVTARCHPHPPDAAGGTCRNLRLVDVLTLGPDFVPHTLPFRTPREVTLAAGESKLFQRD